MPKIARIDHSQIKQVESELAVWAMVNSWRDTLIRRAFDAGVPKARIYEITGIARSTLDKVLQETKPGSYSANVARSAALPKIFVTDREH